MKVHILSRKKVDGKTYRELSCGHEQLEPRGGKSHLFTEAKCKDCGPAPAREKKPRTPRPEGVPLELKAPSKTKVDVRCGIPSRHEPDFAHCKAKCLTCHQWVCGKCEGSNLRIGSRAVPCDRCWLNAEGITAITASVVRAPKPIPVPAEAPVVPSVEIQPAV